MYSEPTLNVLLADVLTKHGLVGAGELIIRRKKDVRKPDVLMLINGIKVILEGKLPKPTARDELKKQCEERVQEGICDISIGAVYKLPRPEKLFWGTADLKEMLKKAKYDVAIWIPGPKQAQQIATWSEVDLSGLGKLIRSAINEVVSTDILRAAVDELKNTLDIATSDIIDSLGSEDAVKNLSGKLAKVIEVHPPKNVDERIRTLKMAVLVLLDATTFYNVIAPKNDLDSLSELERKSKTWNPTLRSAFEKVLGINYEPVFDLAISILNSLPPAAEKALEKIVQTAHYISASKALLKHDLMGRIYHKLLFEDIAKHLATYYTSVPAAWLLARVCLDTPKSSWDNIGWNKPEAIKELRVVDFACGSGTLLSAVYRAVEDKHILTTAENERSANVEALHRHLLEDTIYGFDVMMYAAHIATLTLALHNPEAIFDRTNIFVLPIGGRRGDLGSINFLVPTSQISRTKPLEGKEIGPVRVSVKGRQVETVALQPNSFDLVIMNPPFARSCGDNLMFGHIEDKQVRKQMKKNLTSILDQEGFRGIGQAGLGAVFMVLADKYVKENGRIAFVLPRNLLSGSSWGKIRRLLTSERKVRGWKRGGYHIEYIFLSVEPGSYNFSENTDLSECLIVARKLQSDEEPGKSAIIILHRKPKNVFESLTLARRLIQFFHDSQGSDAYDLFTNPDAWPHVIRADGETLGKVYAVGFDVMADNADNWGRLAAFANPEITKIAYRMRIMEELAIPGKKTIDLQLTTLEEIAKVGPDRRQIHDNFDVVEKGGLVDCLWGRTMEMNTLETYPNARLAAKGGKRVDSLLKAASNLIVAERIWFNTSALLALNCKKAILSNVWWSVLPEVDRVKVKDACKVLALWINSTPGLLLYMSELEVTRGPWTAMKKGTLEKLPILDISQLEDEQIKELVELYDQIKDEIVPFLQIQFTEAAEGKGWRVKLDTEMLSILIGDKIKPKDLMPLYELLAQEPYHWLAE